MSVIITGAAGGLGSAVWRAFESTGTKIIGVEKSWRETMPFVAVSADLTTTDGCNAMVEEALKHGPIDALVHLIGGFSGGTPIAETSDAVWDLMMNINLRAAFLTTRAVLKPMIAAGRGRIVAIGSRAALDPSPNIAAYAVSKAALVSMMKNIAAETKDSGITANVVLPSTIDTPANRKAMPQSDFSRWVAPEAIAKLLVWLASDAPVDLSGAVIPIYGRA